MVTATKCRLDYYVQDLTSSQIPKPLFSEWHHPSPSPLTQVP